MIPITTHWESFWSLIRRMAPDPLGDLIQYLIKLLGGMGLGGLILLLIVIAIVGGYLEYQREPCLVRNKLTWIKWFDPASALVGTNVTFSGCSQAHQADIKNWLLDIYDNLTTGKCLDYDKAVRSKMLDLITCLSLEVTCDNDQMCKVSSGNIPCGVTNPTDLLLGQNKVHLCFVNCGGNLEMTVAHELSHIARYYVYGYAKAADETAAGKIGVDCG